MCACHDSILQHLKELDVKEIYADDEEVIMFDHAGIHFILVRCMLNSRVLCAATWSTGVCCGVQGAQQMRHT